MKIYRRANRVLVQAMVLGVGNDLGVCSDLWATHEALDVFEVLRSRQPCVVEDVSSEK